MSNEKYLLAWENWIPGQWRAAHCAHCAYFAIFIYDRTMYNAARSHVYTYPLCYADNAKNYNANSCFHVLIKSNVTLKLTLLENREMQHLSAFKFLYLHSVEYIIAVDPMHRHFQHECINIHSWVDPYHANTYSLEHWYIENGEGGQISVFII